MTHRLLATIAAAALILGCGEDEKKREVAPEPRLALDPSLVRAHAAPPGSPDEVRGDAGATRHAEAVIVFEDERLVREIARVAPGADGSFAAPIGDDAHARVYVAAVRGEERTPPVALDNDVQAPVVRIDSHPPSWISSGEATYRFSCEEGCAVRCALDGGEAAECASEQRFTGLDDGNHRVEAFGVDEAGNAGPVVTHAFTVDTLEPGVVLSDAPGERDNSSRPTFRFYADEAGCAFACSVDGAEPVACTSPFYLQEQADGPHEFTVHATDSAGNVGSSSHAWTIDTDPPEVGFAEVPPAHTASTSAGFVITCDEADCDFACSLDGASFDPCAEHVEWTELADGSHLLAVHSTDAAGNQSRDATHEWTVDTVVPTVSIDEAPATGSEGPGATFAFSCNETCSFVCTLDGALLVPCVSPLELEALEPGAHAFTVMAVDLAGNASGLARHEFELVAPAP